MTTPNLPIAVRDLEDATRRERDARARLEGVDDRLRTGVADRAEFRTAYEVWLDADAERRQAERNVVRAHAGGA